MSKQKINEDLKKFRLLMEYDFYVPESYEEIEGDNLLGEDDPTDDEDSLGDAPVGDEGMGDEPMGDEGMGDEGMGDEGMGDEESFSDEPIDLSGGDGMDDMGADIPPAEPAEEEIELDVTELVQGTKDVNDKADQTNQNINNLMQKFDELGLKLSQMDGITQKIDSLEREIEKRNPTEKEKLEMRSLNSYPYNLKLTDYWAEKEGQYDVMNQNGEKEQKEYVLTQDDVDREYNPNAIKNSFDEDGFEEEDI